MVETEQTRRHLTPREKAKAHTYFIVSLYSNRWFKLFGDGYIDYEVTAESLDKAVERVQDLHNQIFNFIPEEELELDYPCRVSKMEFVRFKDEEILDDIWENRIHSIYWKHWEPSIKTKDLIKKIEEAEPDWFPCIAYYARKVWSIDLTET